MLLDPLIKALSKAWDALNPQKNLDEHYTKITKAKISSKNKERLVVAITWAKIIYGYWILLIVSVIVVFVGIYFNKP